jgi:hypothetical protein
MFAHAATIPFELGGVKKRFAFYSPTPSATLDYASRRALRLDPPGRAVLADANDYWITRDKLEDARSRVFGGQGNGLRRGDIRRRRDGKLQMADIEVMGSRTAVRVMFACFLTSDSLLVSSTWSPMLDYSTAGPSEFRVKIHHYLLNP